MHSGTSEPSSDGAATGLDGSASENDAGSDGGPIAAATCGNGRVESGEAYDDGNAATGDGCDPLCARETISLGGSHSCALLAPAT